MSTRAFTILAVALAVGLAAGLSPLASSAPDGLERVAMDEGFADRARAHGLHDAAPAPGYAVPGLPDGRLATGLAAFGGTLALWALGHAAGVALRRRRAVAGPDARRP